MEAKKPLVFICRGHLLPQYEFGLNELIQSEEHISNSIQVFAGLLDFAASIL